MKRKRVFYKAQSDDPSTGDTTTEVGNIVLSDGSSFYYVSPDNLDASVYPSSAYSPIGIYVGEGRTMGIRHLVDMTGMSGTTSTSTSGSYTMKLFTTRAIYGSVSLYSTSGDAISDMNGQDNTEKLIAASTYYSSYQSITSTFYFTNRKYPACEPALLSWHYTTSGTSKGQWYVPALGEINLIYENLDIVKTALTKINSVYSDSAVSTITSLGSSTCQTAAASYTTDYYYAYVNAYIAEAANTIRLFLPFIQLDSL